MSVLASRSAKHQVTVTSSQLPTLVAMVSKSVALVLCAVAAVCSAAPQAAKYPAGVDPHVCPNYPDCDNVALANHAAGHSPAPYAAPSYSAYTPEHAGVPRAADAYPAGVNPGVCPNYPYCGPTPAHVPAAAPQNNWAEPRAQNNWAAPAPAYNNWAAPAPAHAPAPQGNWALQALQKTWPGADAAPQNNWAAPAPQPNWAAPAPQQNWAAPAPQNNWAAPAPQNNWAAPAPQSNWASHAPAAHEQPAAAQYPAGVDPHSCPNYPYCS